MQCISCLPYEILREILQYLPISALLKFGQTSHYHHELQQVSLSKLRLGVFPSRLDGLLSLMDTAHEGDTTHCVQNVLKKRKAQTKESVVFNQNVTVARILHRYWKSLRSLEISIWELHRPTADIISRMSRLGELSIRLDHPNSRCSGMDPSFWCRSPGSTVWNKFYAKRGEPPVLGRLQSLNLERVGITDYQLLQIIGQNPRLREIRLRKCLMLTDEFFRELSKSEVGKNLETLHFTQSENLRIDGRILKHINTMPSLKSLSLFACLNIGNAQVQRLNETCWHIQDMVLPFPDESHSAVEIDPEYT